MQRSLLSLAERSSFLRAIQRLIHDLKQPRTLSRFSILIGRQWPIRTRYVKTGLSAGALAVWSVSCLSKDNKHQLVINRAEELYELRDWKGLYDYLRSYRDSDCANILWRLARAARDVAQIEGTPNEEKKTLIYEAFDCVKRATEIDPNNFACQKWSGIILSDVGDYEGNKAKILNAYIIRDHFTKAIELNPTDATSMHLLGLWRFTFADMPWYQRKAAAAFFASPPSSTYEEALELFAKAEEMDPGFYCNNHLMLGKTHMRLGHKEKARFWLKKTIEYRAYKPEDKEAQKEADKLLRELS